MMSRLKNILSNTGLLPLVRRIEYCKNNVRLLLAEAVYRAPNPWFKFRQIMSPPSDEIVKAGKELKREGIVTMWGYIHGQQLQETMRTFSSFIDSVEKSPSGPMKLSPYGGPFAPAG